MAVDGPVSCDPGALMRAVINGDYETALAVSEACVLNYTLELPSAHVVLGRLPPDLPKIPFKRRKTYLAGELGIRVPDPIMPILDLAGGFLSGHDRVGAMSVVSHNAIYLTVTAQILALMGQIPDAEDELARLGSFLTTEQLRGELMPFEHYEDETRALIKEKRGEVYSAVEAYDALARHGRIAVIALGEGNDAKARERANKAIASDAATAQAVLGALSEAREDAAAARASYEKALSALTAITEGQISCPINLAEGPRVLAGLARTRADATYAGLRVVQQDGRRRFADATGVVVGKERWPRTPAFDDVAAKQAAYRAWIRAHTAAGMPDDIFAVAQHPRFFAGFLGRHPLGMLDDNEWVHFHIPEDMEPTGVLDREVIAIPLYKAAVVVAEAARSAGSRLANLIKDDVSSEHGGDAVLGQILRNQIVTAMDLLTDFHATIARLGLVMSTSQGVSTPRVEADAYGERLSQLAQLVPSVSTALESDTVTTTDRGRALVTGHLRYTLPPQFFDDPPDFITAHVPAAHLTRAIVDELDQREQALNDHLACVQALVASLSYS